MQETELTVLSQILLKGITVIRGRSLLGDGSPEKMKKTQRQNELNMCGVRYRETLEVI